MFSGNKGYSNVKNKILMTLAYKNFADGQKLVRMVSSSVISKTRIGFRKMVSIMYCAEVIVDGKTFWDAVTRACKVRCSKTVRILMRQIDDHLPCKETQFELAKDRLKDVFKYAINSGSMTIFKLIAGYIDNIFANRGGVIRSDMIDYAITHCIMTSNKRIAKYILRGNTLKLIKWYTDFAIHNGKFLVAESLASMVGLKRDSEMFTKYSILYGNTKIFDKYCKSISPVSQKLCFIEACSVDSLYFVKKLTELGNITKQDIDDVLQDDYLSPNVSSFLKKL
jgi:hypothetical protein